MFLKRLKDCREFTAGDGSILRELLHPEKLVSAKVKVRPQEKKKRLHLQSPVYRGRPCRAVAGADLQIRYSLACAKVAAWQRTKPHKLKSSEVYYITAGSGLMHIDEESFEVGPESAIYIPPGARQYIENTGETSLEFLCIVEPAWREEDEEILEGV